MSIALWLILIIFLWTPFIESGSQKSRLEEKGKEKLTRLPPEATFYLSLKKTWNKPNPANKSGDLFTVWKFGEKIRKS